MCTKYYPPGKLTHVCCPEFFRASLGRLDWLVNSLPTWLNAVSINWYGWTRSSHPKSRLVFLAWQPSPNTVGYGWSHPTQRHASQVSHRLFPRIHRQRPARSWAKAAFFVSTISLCQHVSSIQTTNEVFCILLYSVFEIQSPFRPGPFQGLSSLWRLVAAVLDSTCLQVGSALFQGCWNTDSCSPGSWETQ